MKPVSKYLLIISLTTGLALGLLLFFANTQPNMQVTLINKSGQPISIIDLQTEKAGKNIRLRGVDTDTEVAVKFHSDGEDSLSTFIRFSDGKEIQEERIRMTPGVLVTQSITEEKVLTEQNASMPPQ